MHLNNNKKGFSLLELLVVIAIMGMVGLMIFSGGSDKAKEIEADFDNIVDYVNLYKNRTLASGEPYFLYIVSTVSAAGETSTSISPYTFQTPVVGNQNNCEAFSDTTYTQMNNMRIFSSEVSQILMCNNAKCEETSSASDSRGICFFTDGSSRGTDDLNNFVIQGSWSNKEFGSAYKMVLHTATSFVEKFQCIDGLNPETNGSFCTINQADDWMTYK